MPELPEVQTVRRFLEDICLRPKAKRIKSIKAFYPGIIKQPSPVQFINSLVGQRFTKIDRYGKYLILILQDFSIISHLRMEGKYIWYDKKYIPQKHDHIQFLFQDGNSLVYNDVRKFGTMCLVKKGQQFNHPSILKLGPQVNDQDTFTHQYFRQRVKDSIKPIKQLILDQQQVCGIGNIYADQILFASKIHPMRKSKSLTQNQINNIVIFGKQIIDTAIDGNGTTIRSFSVNHMEGQNQNFLKVYGRVGEKCQICGTKIQKTKVGGRGTSFCPSCQK